jgi:N-carbamoyl-L-amino-acid hydrolase
LLQAANRCRGRGHLTSNQQQRLDETTSEDGFMDRQDLRVDRQRLRQSLEKMATIGATPGGGVQRLALSDEDKEARDLLVTWMKDLDLDVTVDQMGNIVGRQAGRNDDLAPVMSGSHVDSQPKGGRFDGILGVMGMLEVMRTLRDNGIETERPVVIVERTNEEGSRFSPAMVSSGVWAGVLDLQWAYDRTDIHGATQGDELARIGYRGDAPCKPFPVHAYYEYHIEQGPVLERESKLIGAPKGILCLHWYDIYLEGEANQVGPTPMEGRHDALCAAAEMILAVNGLPEAMGGNMVATMGEIQNEPNSRNIIPDRVFVPSVSGRSHVEVELTSWEHCEAGANVLLQCVLQSANEP